MNTVLTLALAPVAYSQGVDFSHVLLFSIGSLLATYYLSPDLDLEHAKPSKRWGRLSSIWKPYSTLLPHRGISHIPLVGIVTRLGYLLLLIAALLSPIAWIMQVSGLSPPDANLLMILKSRLWIPFILGTIFADTLHIALDWSWSSLKRYSRSRNSTSL